MRHPTHLIASIAQKIKTIDHTKNKDEIIDFQPNHIKTRVYAKHVKNMVINIFWTYQYQGHANIGQIGTNNGNVCVLYEL